MTPQLGMTNVSCILLPRDLIIGQLELGEEDGAVLRASAVYHADDLVAPAHGAHQPQVLYGTLNRLKRATLINFLSCSI